MYLTDGQGKRISIRESSLALAGENDGSEQVQSVLPLGGQQGGSVITRQRPVAARIIRVDVRLGELCDKLGDLGPHDLVQPPAIKVIKAVEVGRVQPGRIKG